jgi:hypothetical protein
MSQYNLVQGQPQPSAKYVGQFRVFGRQHVRILPHPRRQSARYVGQHFVIDEGPVPSYPPYYIATLRQELTPDGPHVKWWFLRWLHAPPGAGEVRLTSCDCLSFRRTCRASMLAIGWSPMMAMIASHREALVLRLQRRALRDEG